MLNSRIYKINKEIFFIDSSNNIFKVDSLKNLVNEQLLNNICNQTEVSNISEEILDYLKDVGILFSRTELKWKNIFLYGNNDLIEITKQQLINIGINNTFVEDEKIDFNYIDFAIYLDCYENYEKLKRYNEIFIINKIDWIKAIVYERTINLGPMFTSQQGICYNCLYSRRLSNEYDLLGFKTENEILSKIFKDQLNRNITLEVISIFIKLILNELGNISNKKYNLINQERIIDLTNLNIINNHILKLPGCFCEDMMRHG